MAGREKIRVLAIGLSLWAGPMCLGIYFFLSVLSLFGTENYAGYFARFLFLGVGYLVVAFGYLKQKWWAAWLGLAVAVCSCAVLIGHYTFVTGKPADNMVVATRIFWHVPFLMAYFFSRRS